MSITGIEKDPERFTMTITAEYAVDRAWYMQRAAGSLGSDVWIVVGRSIPGLAGSVLGGSAAQLNAYRTMPRGEKEPSAESW